MALPVSDSLSNVNEQIEAAARVLGRSKQCQSVFEAIYHGKKGTKYVQELADNLTYSRKQVLKQGKKLADHQIVEQVKIDGDTGYKKIPFFHQNKSKILLLASNAEKLDNYPTKRRPSPKTIVTLRIDRSHAKASQITIDDMDSFAKVKRIKPAGALDSKISESRFKKAIQAILGEAGEFTDWGGEKNDLYTTRVKIAKKRHSIAFAFKGPGTKGKLVPAKLGKNGDQIQRLFQVNADIFIIQYWNQIDQSVIEQLEVFAIAKSVMTQKTIWYGVIDGIDSNRLYIAYRNKFCID